MKSRITSRIISRLSVHIGMSFLPGAVFAADPVAVIPEPSVLSLIAAGAAVGVLVYRNKRK